MSPEEQSQSQRESSTVAAPWARSADEVVEAVDVSVDEGLDPEAVERRRQQYGHNRLRSAERRSALDILVEQFKSIIIALLAAADRKSVV